MRKMTCDEFLKRSKDIWEDKYDYSLVEYQNIKSKVKIIYDGWVYEQSPENHLLGKLCEVLWTTEKFISESKKIWGDKYDYSKVDYKSKKDKVIIIYNGVEYTQSPDKHLLGRRPEKSEVLWTTEKFISESKKIWGDKYDYSLVEYIRCDVSVKIKFNDRVYTQNPTQHLLGYRCERDSIKSQEDYIRKCKERHGDKYDYSLVEYKGSEKKVKIIYDGKIYEQKAGSHLWSSGLVENVIKKRTLEEFISISNEIHSFKYKYDKVDYVNNSTYVTIICPIHGDFNQIPSSHTKGTGCPSCQESKGEKKIKKFLDRYKISYERQKKFDECVGHRNRLPFDFYIPSMNLCIEYDGIQHFKPIEIFGGKLAFERQREIDCIKNKFCEESFINLLRIRYDQYDDIWNILWSNIGTFIRKSRMG